MRAETKSARLGGTHRGRGLLTAFVLFLLFFTSGCVGTRYLEEGEYLLYDQEIKGANKVSEDALSEFYRQEPNRRFPLIPFAPYVWVYQLGLRNYDKEELQKEKEETIEKYDQRIAEAENEGKEVKVKRLQEKKEKKVSKIERSLEEGNLLMRWGEPLAIYDSSLAATTRAQMESFLQTKGYFNGQVSHTTEVNNQRVTSIYQITERKPYIIDTIVYSTPSEKIANLIHANPKQQEIKIGQVYDQNNISAERDRIDEVLKNNGFYDFSKQYVNIQVDSTIGDHDVYINVNVNEPVSGQHHKQYRLDSIIFTTDADIRGPQAGERQTSEFDGITYRYYDYQYYKKILNRRIFIRPDSLYSRQQTLLTQQQLSNLDIFRFININYDTAGGEFIARIYASPLKKYQMSNEAGFNVSQGYPGPFINSSLKARNVFGGLEILELNGRASIEGVPAYTEGQSTNLKSRELSASLGLTFPQFIFPLPESFQSSLAKLNPKTTVQTGYTYINRPEFSRTNFKTTLFYNWQKGKNYQYNFTPVDVNFINTSSISDTFRVLLNTNEAMGGSLRYAFEPSFVTSTSFTSIFSFNDYGSYGIENDNDRPATYFKLFLESGGHTLNFFDLGSDTTIFGGLQYFKFVKFNPDFRQYFSLSRNSTIAYRVNVGVAIPYGKNEALPYEKYFFAGGSNSIRAWRPRRLGPGGLRTDTADVNENGYPRYSIEQPGQILLETSIEYRQKLFGFVDGAVFVDAGNIWRYNNVPGQEEGTFRFDTFYKQIAIGSGLGLRFDFSFLILRFDYGVKIYDPARNEGQRWIGQEFPVGQEIKNGVFNIGIGYPF